METSFCLKLLPSDRSHSTPPQTFLGKFKISKGHKIAIKLKRIWFFNTALTVYGKCYLLNVETSQMYKYVDTWHTSPIMLPVLKWYSFHESVS